MGDDKPIRLAILVACALGAFYVATLFILQWVNTFGTLGASSNTKFLMIAVSLLTAMITTLGIGAWRIGISLRDLILLLILSLGLISLFLSFLSGSYVLTFIGLGLTFWALLFFYIRPTKYVKLELLNSASFSAIVNVEKILANAQSDSEGIYLPPKLLQDYTSSLIFIPTKPNRGLPTAEQTNANELESKNPPGLLITPPGLALSKFFEKELKKLFIEMRFEDLQTLLPKLFDELGITKNLTIQAENSRITVVMRNHVFEDLCHETAKLQRTHRTVGCPLSSALACAFAKTTGKPVVIEKEETDPDKTTTIQFKVLED